MTFFTVPLVGMHFRPPAKALLQVLPTDFPLQAETEPDNEYDKHAIKLMLKSADIPKDAHDDLNMLASGFGFPIEDILAKDAWHLGYVKATSASQIAPLINGGSHKFASSKLSYDGEGKPLVTIEVVPA